MNNRILPYIQVLVPLLLQVAFFQYATQFQGWWYIGFHLLGLLLIPLQRAAGWVLIISGFIGMVVDLATFEGGLFMSSALFMGLFVPLINRVLAPREGYEITDQPTMASMGMQWFVARTWLLLALHHLWMFTWEASRWDLVWIAWGKALTSATLTTALFVLVMLLIQSRRKQR
jgi:hypothetical protein